MFFILLALGASKASANPKKYLIETVDESGEALGVLKSSSTVDESVEAEKSEEENWKDYQGGE